MSPYHKVLGGFPSKMSATLKYVDPAVQLIPPGGLVPDQVQFSLRNLYDPDSRVGGHQPSNYDKLTSIYGTWTVIRTRIKFSVVGAETDGINQPVGWWGFGVSKFNNAFTTHDVQSLMEQPFVKYSDLAVNGSTGNQLLNRSLSATIQHKDWMGLEDEKQLLDHSYVGSDSVSGLLSSTDVRATVWYGGRADSVTATFKVELEFDCIFLEPTLTQDS
jgi:hypothetical protein